MKSSPHLGPRPIAVLVTVLWSGCGGIENTDNSLPATSTTLPSTPSTGGVSAPARPDGAGRVSLPAAGNPSQSTGSTLGAGGRAGATSALAGQAGIAAVGGSAAGTIAGASGSSAATAGGTSGSVGAGTSGSAGTNASAPMAWPAVSDLSMKGAFTSTTKNSSGPMSAYTLFYPTELGKDGLKHPVITWGNGALTTPSSYTILPLLATQGYVVIAANNSMVTPEDMKSGLDWILQQNDSADSPFHQKLDPSKVAAMGYSLGSLGAFGMADDPRITTTVHISGGAMDKAVLVNLKHPAVFLCGDDSDIAHENCESDFEMVTTVPVFYGVFPGDHLGILGSYTAQIIKAAGAWLRWRLMDDATQAATFVGPDCTLCKDSSWVVKQKDFDVAP